MTIHEKIITVPIDMTFMNGEQITKEMKQELKNIRKYYPDRNFVIRKAVEYNQLTGESNEGFAIFELVED